MSSSGLNLENLLIPLEEIALATKNFSNENEITDGKFSVVYRGQLSEFWKNRMAAFKRFNEGRRQGKEEFLDELKFISKFNHENIVHFIGYCDEGNEMILVYEYPVNGSLADHLLDPEKRSCLTWSHRLKIFLDVAKGLDYLHSGPGECGRVIQGSVLPSNILLDKSLKAKICGFNFSALIPGNQPRQQVYKPATFKSDYMDPIYLATGFLKAESDVYSFGVLLFRILTWPGAFVGVSRDGDCKPQSLTMLVQHYYGNRIDSLVDPVIRDQIGSPSFHKINEITSKCISYTIKDRPTMDTIVRTIEEALAIQVSLFFI